MSEHAWFYENLAGYVADGLPADERVRFDKHTGQCRDCAQALAEQREFDAALAKLFADARPKAGFENRVISALRAAPLRRRIQWVKTMRWVGSAAAVILLGVIGFGMHEFAQTGKLPFSGQRIAMAPSRVREASARSRGPETVEGGAAKWRNIEANPDPAIHSWDDAQTRYRMEVLASSKDKAQEVPLKLGKVGGGAAEGDLPLDGVSNSLGYGRMKQGNEGLEVAAKRIEDLTKLHITRVTEDEQDRAGTTWSAPRATSEEAKAGDKLAALRGQPGGALGFNPNGLGGGGLGAPAGAPRQGGGAGGFAYPGGAPAPSDPSTSKAKEAVPHADDGRSGKTLGLDNNKALATPTQPPSANQPLPGLMGPGGGESKRTYEYYKALADAPAKLPPGDVKRDDNKSGAVAGRKDSGKSSGYFRDVPGKDLEDVHDQQVAQDKPVAEGGKKTEERKTAQKPPDGTPAAPNFPKAKTQPPAEPKATARKIIRTGEVEFEIQAFDDAIASVTRLITAIPGAFVATVNSEKLPNGKVRGSIIVRMPPETLDQFLLDMRKELGKTGELKGQRIGSQDVTKAYYDLESRLRAARIMEDRLINIIKSGKGEIKDLLLAEKELGVWRTKIEEMEGEIRYYNNQVAMSTLTITLVEKSIRSAAAMVISERVNMRIESDDVEQSLQTALTAVTEAKGRVTKSDLKQHTAGQYEALLQFEVAPAAATVVKEKLKKLGIVTHHDAQRLQQAEGGAGAASADIKSRQSDVQFTVALYNVANIQPREAYVLHIASEDVPADYRRLQEAVTQANGQVRSGNLNEQDKLNVTAQFDFDVPATARNVIDKLVAGLGDILTRTTTRAAPGETATDRKVGFRLTLRNLATIQPRESYILQIATQDVSAEYRRLQDVIAQAKGQIRSINLSEQDKLNTAAQIDFDVPKTARETIDKLLAGLGDVLARNTVRAGPTDTATDRKIGYRLSLRNLANIPARESYIIHIATTDVSADYRKLQEAIGIAKGQVRAINLNEQDKLNTSAQLDFDVPIEDRVKIDELVASLGEVTARNTVRVPPSETATNRKAGYRLTLRNIASVPPRESYTLQAVSLDVPNGYKKLQEAVAQAKGYVRVGQLNEQDKLNISAQFDFDVPTTEREVIEKVLVEIGDTYSRNTLRVPPQEIATDRKVGYRLTVKSVAGMPPREKVTLDIEVKDVEQAATTFKDMVRAEGGSIVADPINRSANGRVNAMLLFNVPLSAKDALVRKFKASGTVRESKSSTNPQAADTKLATVHIDVILTNPPLIVPSDQGLWPQIRRSLSMSFEFLSLSLTFIVLGLMVVLPWALLVWVAVKLFKRMRGRPQAAAATGA